VPAEAPVEEAVEEAEPGAEPKSAQELLAEAAAEDESASGDTETDAETETPADDDAAEGGDAEGEREGGKADEAKGGAEADEGVHAPDGHARGVRAPEGHEDPRSGVGRARREVVELGALPERFERDEARAQVPRAQASVEVAAALFPPGRQRGVDEVAARDMAVHAERVHKQIAETFGHVPDRKTTIELMPDHEWFAVRITGMP
ncbi:MAG: hypothetical protein AAGM38_19125, partial [Pseudomonadota bacterium]